MPLKSLLLVLGICGFALAQTGEITLDIGDATGYVGQPVTVPIQIQVSGPRPATVVFRIQYDLLTLAFQSFNAGPVIPSDKTVTHSLGPGGVTFLIYGGTSEINTGSLLTLTFGVITPTPGITVLEGRNGSASTALPQAANLPVNFDNGSVRILAGQSSFSCPGDKSRAITQARVLPAWSDEHGNSLAASHSTLALRLDHHEHIDPGSPWVQVESSDNGDVFFTWINGWVVLTPNAPWTIGDVVNVTAGATDGGSEVAPVTHSFLIVPARSSNDSISSTAPPELRSPDIGLPLPEDFAEAWTIVPETPFPDPLEVLVPVPQNLDPHSLAVYLHDGRLTWHPQSNVEGWLAAPPQLIELDGRTYLQLHVSHGGTFAIASDRQPAPYAAAGAPDAVLLALVCAALYMAKSFTNRRTAGVFRGA